MSNHAAITSTRNGRVWSCSDAKKLSTCLDLFDRCKRNAETSGKSANIPNKILFLAHILSNDEPGANQSGSTK